MDGCAWWQVHNLASSASAESDLCHFLKHFLNMRQARLESVCGPQSQHRMCAETTWSLDRFNCVWIMRSRLQRGSLISLCSAVLLSCPSGKTLRCVGHVKKWNSSDVLPPCLLNTVHWTNKDLHTFMSQTSAADTRAGANTRAGGLHQHGPGAGTAKDGPVC